MRRFLPEAIPPESVRRILEAGRLTGSSMNRQPWLFIVVDDRHTLRDVGRLATTGPYIAEAGLAVAVAIERTEYAVSDASRAIQSMILTAWSEDIASNWVGFFGLEQIASLLGLPDRYDLLAVLAFGRPAKRSAKGKKRRKAGSEVFHRGRFGIPFSETSA